jgi:hypothetical protein
MNIKNKIMRIVFFSSASRAHMSLWYPPPLGGAREANSLTSKIDGQFNFPLGCCDSTGAPTLLSPGDCRGHLNLLDTVEGKPQVIWESGQDAYFQLSDRTYTINSPGSTHYGGSCQVGFSIDKGRTWKVAVSYHGNCRYRRKKGLQTFYFTVPTGMPKGPAVFAWIWLNHEHESFMNCASVQIGKESSNSTHIRGARTSSVHSTARARSTDRHGRERSTSIRRKTWSIASHTGNNLERIRHKHRRKHFKYYYYVRAVKRRETPPNRGILPRKRATQTCDSASAPIMSTSYYTIDATCAAEAEMKNVESDNFEIGWSDACGVVEGDGEYPIRDIKCD